MGLSVINSLVRLVMSHRSAYIFKKMFSGPACIKQLKIKWLFSANVALVSNDFRAWDHEKLRQGSMTSILTIKRPRQIAFQYRKPAKISVWSLGAIQQRPKAWMAVHILWSLQQRVWQGKECFEYDEDLYCLALIFENLVNTDIIFIIFAKARLLYF